MIASTLIAATVAAAQPAQQAQPMTAPAASADKKMPCCEKMASGEGCACCKDMVKDGHAGPGKHGADGAEQSENRDPRDAL